MLRSADMSAQLRYYYCNIYARIVTVSDRSSEHIAKSLFSLSNEWVETYRTYFCRAHNFLCLSHFAIAPWETRLGL